MQRHALGEAYCADERAAAVSYHAWVRKKYMPCALQCGECPGVNAFYCEGRGWVLSADEMNKMEFRGQYANIRCQNPGQHVLMSQRGSCLCQKKIPRP